jgi:hypothetical protein
MRFPQLAVGARFRYAGKTYRKTSALLAKAEDGDLRVIPKYAELEPVDGSATAAKPARHLAMVDIAALSAAAQTLHGDCRDLLRQVGEDPTRIGEALVRLDSLHARFQDGLVSPPSNTGNGA